RALDFRRWRRFASWRLILRSLESCRGEKHYECWQGRDHRMPSFSHRDDVLVVNHHTRVRLDRDRTCLPTREAPSNPRRKCRQGHPAPQVPRMGLWQAISLARSHRRCDSRQTKTTSVGVAGGRERENTGSAWIPTLDTYRKSL